MAFKRTCGGRVIHEVTLSGRRPLTSSLELTGKIMATDTCKNCGETIEPGYEVCWNCGTHLDGSPPAKDFVTDENLATPSQTAITERDLSCLRCSTRMALLRRMRFHEGSRAWPFILGELGELFVDRETFDAYACPECGKVEFFLGNTA